MSNEFLHKSYTDEQIEQYVSGNLSKEEMHEFEKYIANDNMLADALEGFLNNNKTSSTQIITEIRERLKTINKRSRIAVLIKNWEAIAAVFVLALFGIAYFLLPAKQVNIPFAKGIKDSTINNTNVTNVTNNADLSKQDSQQKIPSAKEKVILTSKDRKKRDTNQIPQKNIPDNFVENKISNEGKSFNLKGFEIKGKVIDQKGHPIPSVNIFTKGKLINIHTNSIGQFSFHSLDSIVEVVIEKHGFLKKTIKVTSQNDIIIRLKRQ